jgi:integrase
MATSGKKLTPVEADESDIEVIKGATPSRRKGSPAKASVRRNLTEEGVTKYKAPKDRQFDSYYDAVVPGLVLRVNAGGKKTWCALYYVPSVAKSGTKAGQRISMPVMHRLGTHPHLKVKEAREKARQFIADPQKAMQADSGSFREVAETFIKRHVEHEKLRSQAAIEYHLKKYIYPEWQHKPFRELRRGDVADLLDKIEDKHGARNADMCLAIIRKLMNWYTSRNDDYVSPVVKGMGRYAPKDHKRKRILFKSLGNGTYDDADLRAFWNACGEAGTFGALLKVLLLSGQRLDKVATMKRAAIEDGIWTIATQAREKANAGSLRLPQAALDIIEAQPRIAGNPHVFPGSRLGRRKSTDKTPPAPPSFSGFSKCKTALDEKLPADMEPWVLHDLRRTAKSLMGRAGVRPDISERVLGHAIPGVEGVYDRHSYSDEKADALLRLADLVDRIVNPPEGNVVPLRR